MSEVMNGSNVNEVEATSVEPDVLGQACRCKACNEVFIITAGEVAWYEDKGFELPKLCKNCRTVRKQKKVAEEKLHKKIKHYKPRNEFKFKKRDRYAHKDRVTGDAHTYLGEKINAAMKDAGISINSLPGSN